MILGGVLGPISVGARASSPECFGNDFVLNGEMLTLYDAKHGRLMHRRFTPILLLFTPVANKNSLIPPVHDWTQYFQIILRVYRKIGLTVWNGRCLARGVQS